MNELLCVQEWKLIVFSLMWAVNGIMFFNVEFNKPKTWLIAIPGLIIGIAAWMLIRTPTIAGGG